MTQARRPQVHARLGVFTIMAALMVPASAHAAKKVYTPYVEQGMLELEWQGSFQRDKKNPSDDGAQQHRFAVGYGVNAHWFTELYGEIEKPGDNGADFDFTATEWENRFQLTEPGEYWLDVGLYTAYEFSHEDDGADEGELKLLLAKDVGKFTHLANIILEKEFGNHASGGAELGLAWSSRYRYQPWLEPGLEIHSNFGEINEREAYEEQSHQIGPAVYGKLPYGFEYDVGYLFAASDGAPDGEFKWNLEYEIPF